MPPTDRQVEADRVRRIDAGSGFQLWSERVDRELAPDDALADAGSADASSFLFLYYQPAHEFLERSSSGRARPDPTTSTRSRSWRNVVAVGDEGGAVAAHRRALELVEHHLRLVPGDGRAYCDGMCALVELGRTAEAVRWAERARRLSDSIEAGWSHAGWLRHDPDWSGYRDDARFRGLLERLDSAQRLRPTPP